MMYQLVGSVEKGKQPPQGRVQTLHGLNAAIISTNTCCIRDMILFIGSVISVSMVACRTTLAEIQI